MDRDCKTLNLDQCRTRADCATRKKTKSEELMCVKKAVRAPKQEAPPALVRKASIVPKAPRMTAAHKAELRADRPKLPFGNQGSLCVGMNETDCGKAKTACQWTKESADGKRKAHCGKRGETKYESMDTLRAFNSKKYEEERRELTPEEIKQARWAKAAEWEEPARVKLPFGKNGSLCVGMTESDCGKAKKACQWSKASADGKRKAHCGRRVDKVSHGGESDPVLRLFYGY